MKLKIFIVLILSGLLFADDGYVCELSPDYQQYIEGTRETLNDAVKYVSEDACIQDCAVYSSCIDYTAIETEKELLPLTTIVTEAQVASTMEILGSNNISKILVRKDGNDFIKEFDTPIDISTWYPPSENPTENNPIIKKSYALNGLGFEWVKEMSVEVKAREYSAKEITETSLSSIWNDVNPGISGNGTFYIEIDNTKILVADEGKILAEPSLPGVIYTDNFNYVKMLNYDKVLTTFESESSSSNNSNTRCDGRSISDDYWDSDFIRSKPIFKTGNRCEWSEFDTVDALFIEYKVAGNVYSSFKNTDSTFKIYGESYTTPYTHKLNVTIDGQKLLMENGSIVDPTGLVIPQLLGIFYSSATSGYKCSTYPLTLGIGGDLRGNLFTENSSCESSCKVQSGCVSWKESTCNLMGSELSKPVTDYTGKTIYTKKTYNWHCEKDFEEQKACAKWEVTTSNGAFKYGVGDPGFETKDFSANFGDAIGAAQTMEQMSHIWSGWAGFCESGILFDNSWMSDPMQLLSLAMMAYTGALQGGYGTTMQEAAQGTNSMAAEAASNIDGWTEGSSISTDFAGSINDSTRALAEAGTSSTQWADIQSFVDAPGTFISEASTMKLLAYAGDIASIATAGMSVATEDDVKMAESYMNTALGMETADTRALDYANCMASLGLSFVNMAAYSANDMESTSPQLREPWKFPLRMTNSQFSVLQLLTGSRVAGYYKIATYNGEVMTIVALTPYAVTQAGEAICSEKLSVSMIKRSAEIAPGGDNGSAGGAMANAAIGVALSYLPPPYNLIASVIFKVFTSMSNGDACHDEKIAQKWGIVQAKTEKSLRGAQCHLTGSSCAAKWFWGSCMRDKYEYCCYDQETTRIFVEGIKEQLGRGWGNCSDITIYDLQDVSFRQCKSNENPQVNKCFPSGKYDELVRALTKNATKGIDVDRLKDQAMQSLTLPGQKTPWED